ncbi:MAG: bifunctional 4-hydroxy-3-methylbut-2-enyl diphosphate reductase/30S ribosomal protein S1, partial [Bacillota bacterium]|nr:bifunctional 4-hydroxy-3-methylbut-2-enyl diphosphate reductase/30S ribosomal protein S1 [Bacillota bacterium]
MPIIRLAKTAGFCFGVNRAINLVYSLLDEGDNVCTLGPIIHNVQMVNELKEKGVTTVSDVSGISQGSTVVVRSHGVPMETTEQINSLGIKCVDATCPFFAKIHKIVLN